DVAPPLVSRLKSHPAILHELERRAAAHRGKRSSRAVIDLWAELLTDHGRLRALLTGAVANPMHEADVAEAGRHISERVRAVLDREPVASKGHDHEPPPPDDDEVR